MIKFVPFDPATKMSEATATDSTGSPQRIVKGACAVVIGLAQPSPAATAAANELEAKKGSECWRSRLEARRR
jgi:H+-transporting ATPase